MEHENLCENLTLFSNTTKAYELRFTRNGIPEDITGWTVYFTVKEEENDADNDAVIKKDITSHTDPTNGITLIQLTTSDTDREGSFRYDIKFKDDEGNSDILLWGEISFVKPITQRNT